ncbi:MAG: hypothetical protein HC900_01405 [Methylacidiphilales bacterium]|nr:hypothetical protein [Candidatus Methylacidiphilales bacterium]
MMALQQMSALSARLTMCLNALRLLKKVSMRWRHFHRSASIRMGSLGADAAK